MNRFIAVLVALTASTPVLAGCLESTIESGRSVAALSTNDTFRYDFTWVTGGATIRGSLAGEVRGFAVATDPFGEPHQSLAIGYNITFETHPELNVAPQWREFIDVNDSKIVRQETWCMLPDDGCSRVHIEFAAAGHAGLFGMSPLLAFETLEVGGTVGWTVDDAFDPSRVSFTISKARDCHVLTPNESPDSFFLMRGAFYTTFTAPTLTFCGDPLPAVVESAGFNLVLREYVRGGEPVAWKLAERAAPQPRLELRPWRIIPPEGEDSQSPLLLRDAFAWARENDVGFRSFVDSHADVRLHSTQVGETHRSGTGPAEIRTITREIVLETDSGAGYSIEVEKNTYSNGLIPSTISAGDSSETRVDVALDRPPDRLGTIAAARAIADRIPHSEGTFDMIRATAGVPLHDRYIYLFGYVAPIAPGSGAIALMFPYLTEIDATTGGLIHVSLPVSSYFP